MWRRRREIESDVDAEERFDSLGSMLMRMDAKLDRILDAVEDDDGWEEEEEADRS
jgi:hypothetical protein